MRFQHLWRLKHTRTRTSEISVETFRHEQSFTFTAIRRDKKTHIVGHGTTFSVRAISRSTHDEVWSVEDNVTPRLHPFTPVQ